MVNPAYRFGEQHSDNLRAVDDLRISLANEATAIHAPINLPSWVCLAQMRTFLASKGEKRPLAMAKADHAASAFGGGRTSASCNSGKSVRWIAARLRS